ncbi:MAG: STN domain-containing protein, partial [Niastella sp.]|uniref:STN domain-containing protein n=1 Tax=Niastella sp. TaxID=1869183 RepID=UPI00389A30BE
MDLINKCISGWFILLVCAMPGDCLAQQKVAAPGNQWPPFYFDKPITLDSLTRFVHSHSAIRFSFNSSKVKGDKVINLKKGTYTIGLLLQEIRKNTSLYYRMYNGYVIFQDNPPKQRTRRRPVAKKKKPVHTPVRRTQPTDTTHIIKHTNPDSLNRVVAIDTPAAIDPVIAHHGVKDTTANNLLLTTMAGGTPGNNYIDVVDTIKGQTPKGKATPAPVPARNSNRPWVKDTMQTKTKMIRTDVSRKDGRIVARAFRAPWHWQFGLHWKVAIPVNGGGNYFTGPNNRSQPYNPL